MRIFVSLWTIYFLCLSLLPCMDTHKEDMEHGIQVSAPHQESHSDACTPFCSCACCSISINMPPLQNLEFSLLQPVLALYNTALIKSVKEVPFLAFQPPEIV